MRDFWLGATDEPPKDPLRPHHSAFAEHPRHGQQPHWHPGQQRIPSSAVGTLDIRLVKAMDIVRTQRVVRDFIQKQGFFIVDHEPNADERRMHAKIAKLTLATARRRAAPQWSCRLRRRSFER
jgi:hypothetical protein